MASEDDYFEVSIQASKLLNKTERCGGPVKSLQLGPNHISEK